MQNGIYFKHISFVNIKIEQLYIKWNEKLDCSIKEIDISTKKKESKKLNYKDVNKILKKTPLFLSLFGKIIVERINYNNIKASFEYTEKENGFLTLSSPDLRLKSSIFYDGSYLNIELKKVKYLKKNLSAHGHIILDTYKKEITSSIDIDINHDININLKLYANQNSLFYKISQNKNIKSTKYLLNSLNLPKEIRYWSIDAIKMSSLTLKEAFGKIDYKHIDKAYKNLHISAIANKLDYKFNPKLDAVHTKETNLEFKDGVLYIRPQGAYSSGFYLNKSWLKIDFSKKEELLTLYLLFDGSLNKKMLNLLSTYKIKIPFLQNSGKVATNLKLTVNLRTIAVDAKGEFFTKKANFNYLGLNIDIFHTKILLKDYDIKIKNMLTKYKNIATSNVNVMYNAKKGLGIINFDINKINFSNYNISLKDKPLHLIYRMSPKKDYISVEKSHWKLDNNNSITINEIRTPFDLDKLIINIPITLLSLDGISSAYVSGNLLLKKPKLNLDINLLNFEYKNFKIAQSSTKFKLIYDKYLALSSSEKIRFYINNSECSLDKNISVNIKNSSLNIKKIKLNIADKLTTTIDSVFNLKNRSGIVHISSLNIKDKSLGKLFSLKDKMYLYLNFNQEKLIVNSKSLDAKYFYTPKQWTLQLNSLKKISKYSPLLKKYKLQDGNMSIKQDNDDIDFNAYINYPYKLIVKNDIPMKTYNIKGKIDTISKKVTANIGNLVNFTFDKQIKIYARNIGINIPEAINFYGSYTEDNKTIQEQNSTNIIINSNNCYFYIDKNRHIISDTIKLQYYNNITTAQLKYCNGNAGFKLYKDKFSFYGKGFNDKFMENLFLLSRFKGGSFDFNINGKLDKYNGIFYISNTTVLDYKILNNILAFVNTVPSLVTFSLPGYNKTGLPVKKAYMKFQAQNNIFNMSDIYLNSKELDIVGRGDVNLNNNSLDIKLNLKTDIGNNLKKIPLVGYILLGNDSISTTLSITGSLANPKVKSLIAKDIVVAPFNIIKRTLLLPFHYLSGKKKVK